MFDASLGEFELLVRCSGGASVYLRRLASTYPSRRQVYAPPRKHILVEAPSTYVRPSQHIIVEAPSIYDPPGKHILVEAPRIYAPPHVLVEAPRICAS